MEQATAIQAKKVDWTPRGRLYGAALLITLCYLFIGRLFNGEDRWVQVDLPISGASILLLCLAAAETYLYIRQLQAEQLQLHAARERERELSARIAVQRQTKLNRISQALIDKLDFNQFPGQVLEEVAELFDADVVGLWTVDKAAGSFLLHCIHGLSETTLIRFHHARWTFHCFENISGAAQQAVLRDAEAEAGPAIAELCGDERLTTIVLNPILRREQLVGILGIFFREPISVSAPLTAEMHSVSNLIAGAIQAEELYRDLIQIQKIESIGTLASGIAHDFNNVLAAIIACATYVKQQTDPAHPTYRYLEAAESSAHRGAALTKQLLTFARRDQPRLTVVDANECIQQTLKMVERSFDKSILIQRQLDPKLAPVQVEPAQLEQVILNLAVNARDAMGGGGIFTIATRNVKLAPDDPNRPGVALPDGDYVMLSFRDTGHGMSPATLKRIFEPFFTTKAPGKGTGLGLSVVQNIVRSFGGEIRVESAAGKGTVFDVFLPTTDKPLPSAAVDVTKPARGGRETILLVEDEEVIREMAQLTLEGKGYRVLGAADGSSALAKYRESWQTINLVIADMVMPQMSGAELFSHMKEINPGVRVVVSSGYSHDQEGQRMLQHGCLGYLQKPYAPETLCQLVRSVLDSGL